MTHSITQAARQYGIERRTIQRYVSRGFLEKTADGEVELAAIGRARAEVVRRAKNRGRPLGIKLSQGVLLKVRKTSGFFRGRTEAQRFEIIAREFWAIKSPEGRIWLATLLAAELAPQLQQLTKGARKAICEFERAREEFLRGIPGFLSPLPQAVNAAISPPEISALKRIATYVATMLAEFEAKMEKSAT